MSSSTSDWEPPSPEELQALLPQYEINAILGRGGMGAVYEGRQAKLNRRVAIKVLPETFTKGPDELNFAKRFEQEAQAMAGLDHPAIISVYDFGETAEGQMYFVMEFIDGMDIHQYLHSHGGKLPQDQALTIVAHVLDALDYAHSHGIVHRDIKPANILLNREGRVKIADFGLAKRFGEGSGDSVPALTMTNVAVGTPDYVAPEALDSDARPDHRADLYAVGVMLYQLLTGKVPRGQFKSPSEVEPGIDPRIDAIVSRAMQSDPDDRYPTAAAVRADLDDIFSRPLERIEAGEDSAAVPAAVPVTKSVKERKVPVPVKAKTSPGLLYGGIGLAAAVVVGLIVVMGKGGKESVGTVVVEGNGAKAGNRPSVQPSPSEPRSSSIQQVAPPPVPSTEKKIEPAQTEVAAKSGVGPAKNPGGAGILPVPSTEKKSETKQTAGAAKPDVVPAESTVKMPVTQENAAAANAPEATNITKVEPQFPAGKWVKLFTEVSELPNDVRVKISAADWDGWIPPGPPLMMPERLEKNYAIKARIEGPKDGKHCYVFLRRGNSNSDHVGAFLNERRLHVQARIENQQRDFFSFAIPDDGGIDGPYVVEFGVVGNRLVVRFNESLVKTSVEAVPEKGFGRLNLLSPVRDIEVINLDGLPEAEALRLLGIDENGKDLRAEALTLAAAEAAKAAEQAKADEALAGVPELKALHGQFLALESERVTKVFESDVAKLDSGYLGGIDRAIAEAKRAGNLDTVILLEQEKASVVAKAPLPAADAETDPESLKKLRGIYREAFAKLETARAANRKALVDPLAVLLKQLEVELTKQDRIAHAKTVREYCEGLESPEKAGVAVPAAVVAGKAKSEPARTERVKVDYAVSRRVAQFAQENGAMVGLWMNDAKVNVQPSDPLPKEDFELWGVHFVAGKGTQITDDHLIRITDASELRVFSSSTGNQLAITSLKPFEKTPLLETLQIQTYGRLTLEDCEVVGNLTNLKLFNALSLDAPIADLQKLLSSPVLEFFSVTGRLRPEDGQIINRVTSLKEFTDHNQKPGVIDAIVAQLVDLKNLEILQFSNSAISADSFAKLDPEIDEKLRVLVCGSNAEDGTDAFRVITERFRKLEDLAFRGPVEPSVLTAVSELTELQRFWTHQADVGPDFFKAIAKCKKLDELGLGNGALTVADFASLRRLENLKTLVIFDNGIRIDPSVIPEFGKLEGLTQLDLPESQVTAEQADELKQALPNCKINRVKPYPSCCLKSK